MYNEKITLELSVSLSYFSKPLASQKKSKLWALSKKQEIFKITNHLCTLNSPIRNPEKIYNFYKRIMLIFLKDYPSFPGFQKLFAICKFG